MNQIAIRLTHLLRFHFYLLGFVVLAVTTKKHAQANTALPPCDQLTDLQHQAICLDFLNNDDARQGVNFTNATVLTTVVDPDRLADPECDLACLISGSPETGEDGLIVVMPDNEYALNTQTLLSRKLALVGRRNCSLIRLNGGTISMSDAAVSSPIVLSFYSYHLQWKYIGVSPRPHIPGSGFYGKGQSG